MSPALTRAWHLRAFERIVSAELLYPCVLPQILTPSCCQNAPDTPPLPEATGWGTPQVFTMLPKCSLLSNVTNSQHLINPISPFQAIKSNPSFGCPTGPPLWAHITTLAWQGHHGNTCRTTECKPGKGTSTPDTDINIFRILLQREKRAS